MKIRDRAKRLLYVTFSALFLTGFMYEITERWMQLKDQFGVGQNLASVWALRTHSAMGMLFMIVFGYILAKHVEPSLRQKRQRRSGLVVLWCFGILFVTVPFLYYLGDEQQHAWMANLHTWLGLSLAAPFFLHAILLTRRARRDAAR